MAEEASWGRAQASLAVNTQTKQPGAQNNSNTKEILAELLRKTKNSEVQRAISLDEFIELIRIFCNIIVKLELLTPTIGTPKDNESFRKLKLYPAREEADLASKNIRIIYEYNKTGGAATAKGGAQQLEVSWLSPAASLKYKRYTNELQRTVVKYKQALEAQTKQEREAHKEAAAPRNKGQEYQGEEGNSYGDSENTQHRQLKQPLLQQEQFEEEEATLTLWQDATVKVEHKIATELNHFTRDLEKDLIELNTMFREFESELKEQDVVLNVIGDNVHTSKMNVDVGVENLKTAKKEQAKGSKMMFLILGFVVIMAIVIALLLFFGTYLKIMT